MQKVLTLSKRELTSLFYSPVAYMTFAVFAFVSGLLFVFGVFEPGYQASMSDMFVGMVWLLVFVVPAISMRLISEESSTGTIELLMTAPISDTHIVLGKWLGSFGFFVVLLLPIFFQIVVLEVQADPDYGPIVTGLLGILLIGAFYLSIGVFVSALSRSQLVAFMITILITGLLTIGMYVLSTSSFVPNSIKAALYYMNVNEQYKGFARGLIDIRNFVFFLSGTVLFLFLGVKSLGLRRMQ
ncbi:ABC transporter permease [Poriferisphaera sp. WC338]|uniref:ABC transporter permease n=1 Tax=Poriferisphaera sp. WC338 TaxID=3425129 RepID=UPI003D81B80B